MKYLSFAALIIAQTLLSCQNNKSVKKTIPIDSAITNTHDTINQTVNRKKNNLLMNDTASIFMIDTYRIFEESEDPSKILNEHWFDLYEENGKYYLAKVDYKIEDGYNECVGVPTQTVLSKRNSLLFLNFPFLKAGKIENLKITQAEIWPKETVFYNFNNQQYQLKGYGDIVGTQVQSNEQRHDEVFHEVKNYKLTYSFNGAPEVNLIQEQQFDDTFIKTLFVGDIDRDGKLDFIISNPTNYEENSIMLILSSQIIDDDIENSSFQQNVQFDC